MKLPGYTAEASLGTSGRSYRSTAHGNSASAVIPQARRIVAIIPGTTKGGFCYGVEDDEAGQSYVICD